MALGQVDFKIDVGGPTEVIDQPPQFVYPSDLGFGVAVGIPYDLFYVNGAYFLYRGGDWFKSSSYGGNWEKVRKRKLPAELRRQSMTRIHQSRDREYSMFQKDRERYPGPPFRKEGGEEAGPETGSPEHKEVNPPAEESQDKAGKGQNKPPEMKGPAPGKSPEMKDEEPEKEEPAQKPDVRKPGPDRGPVTIPI